MGLIDLGNGYPCFLKPTGTGEHRWLLVEGSQMLVAEAGIEPALPKELHFECSASTNSATQPSSTSGVL